MKVFAHRGVSALFPENSQSALRACKDSNMNGVEIDLFQAGDDFFIVHDPWLSRLFGINKKITEMDEAQAATLLCQDGKLIPNLEWLIKEFTQQSLILNIELKTVKSIDTFIQQLSELIEKYQFSPERLLISSFDHRYLKRVSEQRPNWKLGLLIAHHPLDISPYFSMLSLYSLHLCIDAISAELLQAAQQYSVQVFVYTVDQKIDIEFLQQHKVDGIFANHPEQAYKIINKLI